MLRVPASSGPGEDAGRMAVRGCGGIGRRARFRSVWGQPRGGSSPLIRIAGMCRLCIAVGAGRDHDLTTNVPVRPVVSVES